MIPYESMKMQVSYQNMVAGSQHGDSLRMLSTNAARADWDNALIKKKNMVAGYETGDVCFDVHQSNIQR